MKVFTHKKNQDHVPCSFAYKAVCVYDRFPKSFVVFRGENADYEFIKAILNDHKYCKKVTNKHFNKNLLWVKKKNIYFNQVTVVGFVKKLIDNDE